VSQTDKDLLFLNVLYYLLYNEKREITEIVPDFDLSQIRALSQKMDIFKTKESYENSIKKYANEVYNRIQKKFPGQSQNSSNSNLN
jgi:hypothetical protein